MYLKGTIVNWTYLSINGGSLKITFTVSFSLGSPITEDEWNAAETAVNAFTLVHHDLNVCTNSLQYVMLLDIINNLLLYSEPTLKVRNRVLGIFLDETFYAWDI